MHDVCVDRWSSEISLLTYHQTTFYGSVLKYKERSNIKRGEKDHKGSPTTSVEVYTLLQAIFCYLAVLSRGRVAISVLK